MLKLRNVAVEVKNRKEGRAAIEFFLALNPKLHANSLKGSYDWQFISVVDEYPNEVIGFDSDSHYKDKVETFKFREMHKIFLTKTEVEPIKVVLNKQYTALVSADTIEVGCQKFPRRILTDLVDAANRYDAAAGKFN